MKNLDKIAEELFNKIRGRFPNITIGDEEGNVTNIPTASRFFDFKFKTGGIDLGSVSVSIDEDKGVTVLYSNDLVANEDNKTRNTWYDFLKELRTFSKKRLLNFNTRDITKSNLNKRDYKFLAKNKSGENNMNESKLYGTSRVSYQDIDNARLVIKHTESVNSEIPTGRTQKIGSIFVDNAQGERFKYPYKHIAGARAMARHVAEGGIPHDDFGKHIIGLSEELSKLRKFKSYMGRSAVMAEGLTDYMDVVKERVATVKKTIESLQKKSFYAETIDSFEAPVLEEVPSDVAENWIDELTIRQFNEELKDVFPYIYKLVSENTRATELGPLDLEGYTVYEGEDKKCSCCGDTPCSCDESCPECGGKGMYEATIKESDCPCCNGGRGTCSHGKEVCGTCGGSGKVQESVYDEELEKGFEEMMGQFAEGAGEYSYTLEYNGEENGYAKHKLTITSPEGKTKVVADDFTYFDTEDPEELQAELESWFHKGMGVADASADESMDEGDGEEHHCQSCKGTGCEECNDTGIAKDYEDESFDPQAEPSKADMMADEFMSAYEKGGEPALAKAMGMSEEELDQEMSEYGRDHNLHMDDDRDEVVQGYIELVLDNMDEGNAYANAVRQAKKDGKKKGDKIQGPDGDEITLEKDKKTPLGEFILSHFDKETGEFPKGETAVLTMVEKDYGDKFIEPAKQFIEKVYQTCEAFDMVQNPQQMETDSEFDRIKELAGLR